MPGILPTCGRGAVPNPLEVAGEIQLDDGAVRRAKEPNTWMEHFRKQLGIALVKSVEVVLHRRQQSLYVLGRLYAGDPRLVPLPELAGLFVVRDAPPSASSSNSLSASSRP